MNKFWEWMRDKQYAYDDWLIDIDDDWMHPTKQMLIGYMLEYVLDRVPNWGYMIMGKTVDDYYEMLVKQIEKLEKKTIETKQ